MVRRASWLSVTPEPERELPEAVATLARRGRASAADVERERARIEGLVLRGNERGWLAYLGGVVDLIEETDGDLDADPDLVRARARARAVISNHHNLLLALPGRGAEATARDRTRLAATPTE